VVVGEDDAVQIVSELFGVDCAVEVPFTNRPAGGCRQRLQPIALELDQSIACRTRSVIEIHRGLHEHAATRPLFPLQPAIEQCLDAWHAAVDEEGGLDDNRHEAFGGAIEHLDLQRFLRAEVREEAALGQLEVVGESADGQPFESHAAGEIDGVVHDGVAGGLPFSHASTINERSC
jgi:hypothetical protein